MIYLSNKVHITLSVKFSGKFSPVCPFPLIADSQCLAPLVSLWWAFSEVVPGEATFDHTSVHSLPPFDVGHFVVQLLMTRTVKVTSRNGL